MKSCCAICVTYNPSIPTLQKLIASAVNQVDKILIIDNGSDNSILPLIEGYSSVDIVQLNKNYGVAAGYNSGIQLARKEGFQYVLFLDQDSVLPDKMISRYIDVLNALKDKYIHVASIGPRYRNTRTGHISRFVRFRWFHNSYYKCRNSHGFVPADFLISSGSFCELAVFDKVGLFKEDLFIDHVDTEWFLRAASLGLNCYGVCDVIMEHSLGEGELKVWLLRWHMQPLHKPFRLYYIFRNSVLLYRMPHSRLKWISGDVLRLFRLLLVYLAFSSKRREALKWIFHGVRDGILNVKGRKV